MQILRLRSKVIEPGPIKTKLRGDELDEKNAPTPP
jgi:hypothetical protein